MVFKYNVEIVRRVFKARAAANPTVLVAGRSYSLGGQQGGQVSSWKVKGQSLVHGG